MDDEEMIDYRHSAASSDGDKNYMLTELDKVVDESKLTRRKIIGRTLLAALATILLPMIVGLADLGPWPTKEARRDHREDHLGAGRSRRSGRHFRTVQARGHRDRTADQRRARQPQELHGSEFQIEKAKAAVIVVRMDPNTITIPPSREGWQIGGILCYSKICTHVGCPISLWATDPPPAVPVPPVDFRPWRRGKGGFRPREASFAAAADHDGCRGLHRRPA